MDVHQPRVPIQDHDLELCGGLLDLRFDRDQLGEFFGGDGGAFAAIASMLAARVEGDRVAERPCDELIR